MSYNNRQTENEQSGTFLDQISYTIMSPVTDYILENTEYRDYTSRIDKLSRYYISRAFFDTFLFFVLLSTLYIVVLGLLTTFRSSVSSAIDSFTTVIFFFPWFVQQTGQLLPNVSGVLLQILQIELYVEIVSEFLIAGRIKQFYDSVSATVTELIDQLPFEQIVSGIVPNSSGQQDTSLPLFRNDIFEIALAVIIIIIPFIYLAYRLYYPVYYTNEQRRSIQDNISSTYVFLYALVRGGLDIGSAMKILGNSEEVYGKTSEIFRRIIKRSEFSQSSLRESIRTEAEETDNQQLSDFLNGLVNNLNTGGDVTGYIQTVTQESLEKERKDQESYFNTLELISQIFVVVVVVLPVFIIITQLVAGLVGSIQNLVLMQAIPYVVVPTIGVVIAAIVYTIASTREKFRKIDVPKTPYEIKAVADLQDEEKVYNPLKNIIKYPYTTLIVTVPLVILHTVALFQLNLIAIPPNLNNNLLPITLYLYGVNLMIVLVPWSIAYEIQKNKRNRLESQLTDLLENIRSSNQQGLTLYESLESATKSGNSGLYEELSKTINQLSVTGRMNRRLIKLANELRVPKISESFYVITVANRVSGNISPVINIITENYNGLYQIRRERVRKSKGFAVTIFIVYLVGILLLVALDFLLFEYLFGQTPNGLGEDGEGGGAASEQLDLFGDVNEATFRRVFLHTTLSIGLVSGLVIGVIENGEPQNGFKYIVLFSLIGSILFTVRITLF